MHRQLFLPLLNTTNKANSFTKVCNGGHIPRFIRKTMGKCNQPKALQDKQQFRSFWHSRPLHNASDNDSYNLDYLWAAKLATAMEQTQNQPKRGDWRTNPKEEKKERGLGIAVTTETDLARKAIQYGDKLRQQKWLNVQYQMGRSGQKFLQFNKSFVGTKTSNFPKIHVPKDVFAFVRAMDQVLNAVNANKDKIEVQLKTNNPNQQQIVLHTAKAKGSTNDFKLDLCLGPFLTVQMRTVPNWRNPGHKPKFFIVPIGIFCWMRRAIGEVFVENGEPEVQHRFGEQPIVPNKLLFLRTINQ